MTKKAEHEARVEANKRDAFVKKVRTLIGHVGDRVATDALILQYEFGATAEETALRVIAKEPVAIAVFPLKVEAVKDANEWAKNRVAQLTKKLEAANWDLNAAAPRPRFDDANYKAKQALRSELHHISRSVEPVRRMDAPEIVKIDDEGVARYIASAERDTADMYDAYVCKLVVKVGPVDAATLIGSQVWSNSILEVKKGATVERWKTQQITNVSVLGKYFPQWPTRLLKGGAK